jgi:hypothetical protein
MIARTKISAWMDLPDFHRRLSVAHHEWQHNAAIGDDRAGTTRWGHSIGATMYCSILPLGRR